MYRTLITAPLAILVSTGFLLAAAGPAAAQDERCTTLPEQARVAVQSVDAGTAKQALRYIATGEKLCEAGNEREAAKKFAAALKLAGPAGEQQLAALKR